MKNTNISYSIIVPLMNEEENVFALIQEIDGAMKCFSNWELICIDDGSSDLTWTHLKLLAQSRPYMKLISFDKNYGQTSAFAAGFKAAKGHYIITIDGDLQNDPNDIPQLLTVAEKFDLVCGIRNKRKDSLFKKIISKVANSLRSRLCQDGVVDTGCSLKILKADALKEIPLFKGMHRFLPALFKIHGFSITQVPVNHRQRKQGKSKYHIFNRFLQPIVDMFVVMWMRKRFLNYTIQRREGL